MRDYHVPPLPESVWKNPWHFIAFGFGSGTLPIAPGTFGTLMAVPFYLVMQHWSNLTYFIVIFIAMLASMWLCTKVSREIGIEDHQGMCIDEFIGYWVTMFAAPQGIVWIITGFILFRLFDIWKPFPIGYVDDKMQSGAGMILDDVLAGVYACIILHLLAWIF